ncbi:hypothetical protein EJ110_NYTH24211 [Nymphaea thermarum]|nr:hypothetical protein EJ110_NYTH24211 [Nymphaea thermarum]
MDVKVDVKMARAVRGWLCLFMVNGNSPSKKKLPCGKSSPPYLSLIMELKLKKSLVGRHPVNWFPEMSMTCNEGNACSEKLDPKVPNNLLELNSNTRNLSLPSTLLSSHLRALLSALLSATPPVRRTPSPPSDIRHLTTSWSSSTVRPAEFRLRCTSCIGCRPTTTIRPAPQPPPCRAFIFPNMQDPSEGVFSSIAATLEPSDHHHIPPVSSDYHPSSTCTIYAFQVIVNKRDNDKAATLCEDQMLQTCLCHISNCVI